MKQRVLLVEDEAKIALAERSTLESAGYDVLVAHSGEKAISILLESNVDLILVHIDLGRGIDGTTAAETILATRELPVVFLSSYTEPEIVKKLKGSLHMATLRKAREALSY